MESKNDESNLAVVTPSEPVWRPLIAQGKLASAAELISEHLKDRPDDIDATEDLAVVLGRQRKFSDAATKFKTVVARDPSRAGAWRHLGRAYVDLELFAEAEPFLMKAAELHPREGALHQELGDLYRQLKKPDRAVKAYEKAVALVPDSSRLRFELGRVLSEIKRHVDAKAQFVRALELQPDYCECLTELSACCKELRQDEESLKYLKDAVRVRPGSDGVHNNLGVAMNDQRRHHEAIECYNKAIAINPNNAILWNNLGNALRGVGQYEASISALETALRLRPNYPEAFNNLAIGYVQLGENDKALDCYNRALCFRPDYAECHMNRALQRLILGDLSNGWADYEWRWQLRTMRARDFKKPMWDGSPLGGKKILIYWEQGLGDSVQFIRYAKELKDRGATVIFEGQPPLQAILSRTPGIDHFIPRGDPLPDFDFHAPLLSLPGQFHTTLENVPSEIPYISPDPHFVKQWKPRLDRLKGIRVGITWQGNPDHRGDHIRSFPLRLFESLAKIEGVTLISLQKNHGLDQVAQLDGLFEVVCFDDLDEGPDAFLGTAAVLKNIDLVITADTAIVHLAGAMGVPTWLVAAMANDWRWLRHREDSPWYPSVRIFRQQTPGDWKAIFDRLAIALKERVAASPRKATHITPDDRRKARDFLRRSSEFTSNNQKAEAEAALESAIEADPQCAEAHHDLGALAGRRGQFRDAISRFRIALELRPDWAGAYANIGLAFLQNEQFPEAASALRKALRLGGGSPDVYNNLGTAFMELQDPGAAEANFIKAMHLRPDFPTAHFNLARALLVQGKFEEGWLEFEWRTKRSGRKERNFKEPLWAGESIIGRTILLYVEDRTGLHETLLFLRYARVMKDRGARVIVECQEALVALIARCPLVDEVVARGTQLPPFDLRAPLLSVPAIIQTTLHTIPSGAAYLDADPVLVERWAPRLSTLDGMKVAILWDGELGSDGGRYQSIPVENFRRLAQISGVRLVSLQTGRALRQLKSWSTRVTNLGAELESHRKSYADTAAVLSQMDLIITADSVLAHLAGAMGLPVWLVLTSSPHFVWMLDRQDSLWYPSIRIFRQRLGSTWDEVFDQIADDLRTRIFANAQSSRSTEAAAKLMHEEGCRRASRCEWSGASDYFSKAAELQPDWAQAHHDLAVAEASQSKIANAIDHFRRALALDPAMQCAYGNLALAMINSGNDIAAADEISKLLDVAPDLPELNWRMGIVLIRLVQNRRAMPYLERGIALQPHCAEAHFWLGKAHENLAEFGEAEKRYRKAIQLRPEWAVARCQLGVALAAQGNHSGAIEECGEAIRLKPNVADFYAVKAKSLMALDQLPQAIEALQHATYILPEDSEIHCSLARALLLFGAYEQGWLENEWRHRTRDAVERRLPGYRWDGAALKGQKLLLTSEPDIRNTLQFVRYAKLASESGARTIVECEPALAPLFKRCAFIDRVVPMGQPLNDITFHCSMMSMPIGFQTSPTTIPSPIPYLKADEALAGQWAHELAGDGKPLVGVALSRGTTREDAAVTCLAAALSPMSNARFLSLDKAASSAEPAMRSWLGECPDRLYDSGNYIEELAALLANMKAVIAWDGVVAHLAGAMGIAVYLFLPMDHDWRWMREVLQSPWYPTLKVFRQPRSGEWAPVFQQIADALSREI